MKMDKISFRRSYDEHSGYFEPFKDDKGLYAYKADIIAEPFTWISGSAITFRIVIFFSPGNVEKEVTKIDFYDRDYLQYRLLLSNLASEQLRGQIAEDTASELFWHLFRLSPELKQYLPKLAEFYEKGVL